MSKTPKKKSDALKELATWMKCRRCSVLHSTEDETKHRVICSEGQQNVQDSNPGGHRSHSVVCMNRLTAPIHLMCGDSYHKTWRGNYVFLHPDTMKAIGSSEMALMEPAVIDNWFGFRMFPDSSVPLTSIGCYEEAIYRLEKSSGDWLTLKTGVERDEPVDRIHLQFTEELPPQIRRELNLQEFKSDFFFENESHLFYVGEHVKFKFLNNEFSMIVRYISSGSTVSDVVESFSQLEISSAGGGGGESDIRGGGDTSVAPKMFFNIFDTITHLVITHAGPCFTLNSFGGCSALKKKVLRWVKKVLNSPTQYMGEGPILSLRMVLLVGLPGVGKTMFVTALANTAHVSLFLITPEIIQDESSLKRLEDQIIREGPCIVFFDNLDIICPAKDREMTYKADEFIRHLLEDEDRIFIFGATNNMENVNKYILRSNRFEIMQTIDLPKTPEKIDILKCLLKSAKHSLTEEDIKELATRAQHFSGLDLSCLCDKAKARARCRLVPEASSSSSSRWSSSSSDPLTMEDFLSCLPTIEPYMLKTLYQEMPFLKRVELKVTWDDVVGHSDMLKKYGYWCTAHHIDEPEFYKQHPQLKGLHGMLLFGPSGCSKTMVAKAIARDWQFNFFFVEGNSMAGKYVGSTEANIKKLFDRARHLAPTLIFFDNVESLAMIRNSKGGQTGTNSRILNQMLAELDRNKDSEDFVAVIAATSQPELLDPAFHRCGRFDKVVYMTLPDDPSRRELLLRKMALVDDVLLEELVRRTKGYSHAEIIELVEAARLEQRDGDSLCLDHFQKVFPKIQARTTPERIAVFDEFHMLYSH